MGFERGQPGPSCRAQLPLTAYGMTMGRGELTHADWLVLGALGAGATHGFAVSQMLGAGGELGRIWAVPRPLVYQSLKKLVVTGYVTEVSRERSHAGPARTTVALTPRGEQTLNSWLVAPVPHLRDMRPLLLAKLVLLERLGREPLALVDAQLHELGVLMTSPLSEPTEDDVDQLIASWRRHLACGIIAFLNERRSAATTGAAAGFPLRPQD